MKAESLIFDIDGTLWDSTDLVAQGYNRYLSRIGLSHLAVTGQYLKGLFGRTMTEIADVLFEEIEVPQRYEIMTCCMAEEHQVLEQNPCRIAYPGVVQTLEHLAQNHRLFIVSNSQAGYPQLLMKKLGIEHLISGTLCYGDTGTCKGETIRTLMTRHAITDAVYIGDTQGDLEASEMAGIPFLFCRYGFGHPKRWDGVVDQFSELEALFGGERSIHEGISSGHL